MHGHVPSPTGQPDQDRLEILSGPGHDPRQQKSRKGLVIAASALVALLAAGGVGFAVLGSDAGGGQGASVSQPTGEAGRSGEAGESEDAEGPGEDLGDSGESAEGDATLPEESGESAEGDATPVDPPADESDTGSAGPASNGDGSKGTPDTGSKDKPGTQTGNGQQQKPAETGPADGPAGAVAGQCAKDGC
ncbi:hypothetical protein ACFSKW_47185 [Nonomuraea mangrovi]|uniref:Uncharacterized protein n=1 Tax=Nonomuraea mangrovi TaxID=2316207 RepID=A0ABW4TEA0_9ACTN